MALYRYAENNSSNTGYYKNTDEFKNQTLKNRSANYDNAPGNVFYNTLAWVYDMPSVINSKQTFFSTGVNTCYPLETGTGTRTYFIYRPATRQHYLMDTQFDENVRYAVYAVPIAKRNEAGAFSKSENLVAITYDKQFRMKKAYRLLRTNCRISY